MRDNYKPKADADFVVDVRARAEHRFPAFAGMKLIEAYAALDDVTPDGHPFVGPRARGGLRRFPRRQPAWLQDRARHPQGAGRLAAHRSCPDDFRQVSHDRVAAGRLFVQAFGGNRG